MTLAELTAMVEAVPGLKAVERRQGLVVDIERGSARASIALQGAQLLSWTPAGHEDVLWCSSISPLGGGKAIRGGIPLCWPWFGPHESDPRKPQHGFARNVPWHLVDVSELEDAGGHIVLTLALASGVVRRSADFFPDLRTLVFIDIGQVLSVRLETENCGTTPAKLSEALHPYFRVGDVSRIRIDGLDGARYRDNADGGRVKTQSGALSISRETTSMFDEAPAVTNIVDPVMKRCISIMRESDARSTVVWNPGASAAAMADLPKGEESEFVCVESGNIGAAAVTIAPGETHTCGVVYAVERI